MKFGKDNNTELTVSSPPRDKPETDYMIKVQIISTQQVTFILMPKPKIEEFIKELQEATK